MPHAYQDLITMITSYRASFEEFYPISELDGALRLQFFGDSEDDAFFPKYMQYLFIIHAVSYITCNVLFTTYIYHIYDSVQNSVWRTVCRGMMSLVAHM